MWRCLPILFFQSVLIFSHLPFSSSFPYGNPTDNGTMCSKIYPQLSLFSWHKACPKLVSNQQHNSCVSCLFCYRSKDVKSPRETPAGLWSASGFVRWKMLCLSCRTCPSPTLGWCWWRWPLWRQQGQAFQVEKPQRGQPKKPKKIRANKHSGPCPAQRSAQGGSQTIETALKHLWEMDSEYKEYRKRLVHAFKTLVETHPNVSKKLDSYVFGHAISKVLYPGR